jgi:hypothetical protein
MKGSQVGRFEGTTKSALDLIELVARNTPQPLEIQREMVDDRKPLSETGAGLFVNAEIDKLRREYEQDLAAVNEEMKLALREKDEDMQKLLKEELERSEKAMDELRKQQQMLKKEDREGMERDLAQLEVKMNEKVRGEMAQFKENVVKQLEEAIETSRVKAEKDMREAVTAESQQKINEMREETEQRVRAEAAAQMKQETDRLQKQAEQQLKERMGEYEQRRRDEQDLKDAGYDPRDGQNSATVALCTAVQNRQELRIIHLLLAKGATPTLCIYERARISATLRALLKNCTDENFCALHLAAWAGNADAIRIFIQNRVDPDAGDRWIIGSGDCGKRGGGTSATRARRRSQSHK